MGVPCLGAGQRPAPTGNRPRVQHSTFHDLPSTFHPQPLPWGRSKTCPYGEPSPRATFNVPRSAFHLPPATFALGQVKDLPLRGTVPACNIQRSTICLPPSTRNLCLGAGQRPAPTGNRPRVQHSTFHDLPSTFHPQPLPWGRSKTCPYGEPSPRATFNVPRSAFHLPPATFAPSHLSPLAFAPLARRNQVTIPFVWGHPYGVDVSRSNASRASGARYPSGAISRYSRYRWIARRSSPRCS
ncbi:MAG: hypothetical protein KatS3mg058_0607 [Roseiflexus sp.]|nr:MAG: hypothetical protein KatS3mg058_0607 [Roseiflexus sp.]